MRAAFVTTAATARPARRAAAQAELVALADELGILLAGPNGQGVISTPASLCAQIVAPYPPPGRIAVASQSGNFVSSFHELRGADGVGVSRAISAATPRSSRIADYLEYFADDPGDRRGARATSRASPDGARSSSALRACPRKPLVLVKGGAPPAGQAAAASHTGSLASDDRVFDGMCRQAGAMRAPTIEEAFEAAATFATQPLPRGPRVVVSRPRAAGACVTADACAPAGSS